MRLGSSVLHSRAIRNAVSMLEAKLPPLRAWHRFEYEQHFFSETPAGRMFAGVYETREAALRAIPAGFRVGYDHPEVADRHTAELGHVWPSDYPVIFWMSQLLAEGVSIFDLGGNVGIHFYGFQRCLKYPAALTWKICEVPHVARHGAELARTRQARQLSFTTDFAEADGADILLASGTLQFLSDPWWLELTRMKVKPPHLLINRTPLWEGPSFVTLHNLGPSLSAYAIRNRGDFLKELLDLGYTLRDSWEVPDFSCYIPFHPDRSIKAYTGMYLHLRH